MLLLWSVRSEGPLKYSVACGETRLTQRRTVRVSTVSTVSWDRIGRVRVKDMVGVTVSSIM